MSFIELLEEDGLVLLDLINMPALVRHSTSRDLSAKTFSGSGSTEVLLLLLLLAGRVTSVETAWLVISWGGRGPGPPPKELWVSSQLKAVGSTETVLVSAVCNKRQ